LKDLHKRHDNINIVHRSADVKLFFGLNLGEHDQGKVAVG